MDNLKKIIKNSLGMSMIEVLLASGMAAGLGLVVAKISQQSQRVNKTAESNLEMLSLTQNISYILSDKDSCIETIQGAVGANISAVKKISGGTVTEVYKVNEIYGNRTYKLVNMTTESAGPGMVNFVVEIERESETSYGGKGIKKKLPLKAVLSSDGSTILSCFSDTEDMIETAVKASCQGDSAKFDPVTKQCFHETEFTVCGVGEVLKQVETDDGKIKNVCVSIIPEDKVCGPGEYLKAIHLDGKVDCEALATKTASCGVGQYARSLSGGDLECINIPKCSTTGILRSNNSTGELYCQDIPCDTTNQYFAGFNGSGNVICKNFPDKSCGTGQYIKEVNPDGTVVCGQVPNHMSLPNSNFSFVDGFNAATNTWSRKTLNQTAEAICNKMEGYYWSSGMCRKNAASSINLSSYSYSTEGTSYIYGKDFCALTRVASEDNYKDSSWFDCTLTHAGGTTWRIYRDFHEARSVHCNVACFNLP